MQIFEQASHLWVNSTARAISFLMAAATVIAALLLVERFGTEYLFQHTEPAELEKSEWERLPFQIAKASAMDADFVILIGGSTSRELAPSDRYMSRELSKACDRPIRFLNAGSSGQVLPEGWALTSALPKERLALAVIGLNNLRLEDGPLETRRAFNGLRMPFGGSPSLRAVLDRYAASPTYAFPPLGKTGWLLARSHRLRLSPPLSFDQYISQDGPAEENAFLTESNLYLVPILTAEQKQVVVSKMISERLPVYSDVHHESTLLWTEFIREFSSPSSSVLFLNLPSSKSLLPLEQRTRTAYENDMVMLRAAGARVEPLRGAELLSEDDFYDQQHLVESGRRKIANSLVAQLASSIPSCKVRG